MPANTTICQMKNVYLYGLKSRYFFYAHNKTWPHHWKYSAFKKKLCCATIEQILFGIKRGDESSLRPNQPRSSLYLLNHPDKRRDTHSEWKHYQPNIMGDKDVCLIISPIVLQHCPALACNHHRTAPSLNVPRSPCMARRACSAAPVATSCMAAAPAPASSLTPKHKCTGRALKGNAEVSQGWGLLKLRSLISP